MPIALAAVVIGATLPSCAAELSKSAQTTTATSPAIAAPDTAASAKASETYKNYVAGKQFIPMQSRLAGNDLLNEYITHTGSAVFACPPGLRGGDYWGSTLLT